MQIDREGLDKPIPVEALLIVGNRSWINSSGIPFRNGQGVIILSYHEQFDIQVFLNARDPETGMELVTQSAEYLER